MIHIVFSRNIQHMKVYTDTGAFLNAFDASGDAWGDGEHGPYGHDYPIPPGHYLLTGQQVIDPPTASEGAGQIDVVDMDSVSLQKLVSAGKADTVPDSTQYTKIGDIFLPIGKLAEFDRSEIMIHGGGSNLVSMGIDPQGPNQPLCKTYGCTRMHNADLRTLMGYLGDKYSGNVVVFSVIGDPLTLSY